MISERVAVVGALVYAFPPLIPVLEEHLADNFGQVLAHPLLSDVIRFLAKRVDSDREWCREVMHWLEAAYLRGPEEVAELVVVSGVEMLPSPGEPGDALRQLLGPALLPYDSWSNT